MKDTVEGRRKANKEDERRSREGGAKGRKGPYLRSD